MARRGRRRAPPLDRRKTQRAPKRRFIIFCEGANTEPAYFAALGERVREALIAIETVPVGGAPRTVAEQAIKRAKSLGVGKKSKKGRDSFESRDEVWAVFDRDAHPNYYDAIQICEANSVGAARSNPCFELWLILHLEDFNRPDDRRAVQRYLKDLCPDYEPNGRKLPDCNALLEAVEEAERRAEWLMERREEERDGRLAPPYTTVWRLTRAIGSAGDS